MLPTEAVATVTGTMAELQLDHAAVDNVRKGLMEIVSMLDDDSFGVMATIQRTSFGDNTAATTLAYHHGLAQQVMNTTMQGMKKDLEALVANVVQAATLIQNADDSASGDLKKRQAVVEVFDSLYRHSNEERQHSDARNHQQNPFDADGYARNA